MELGVRIVGLVLRLLKFLLSPLWWMKGGRRPLIVDLDPWLKKSAVQLTQAIRNGEITSEDLVRKYISQIQTVNRHLNAVADDRFRAAVEDAKTVDRMIEEARKNGVLEQLVEGKPLLGIPCTVKESCSVAGLSNSVGCIENAGSRATIDGIAVSRLRAAGGIPLLVSNTPELCLGWETTNNLRGATNNPYDMNRTPGGSSGGEAALVACGATPLSLASDIAGSIRVPAAFCGVFGHKPSPGVVPHEGHIPFLEDEQFAKFLSLGPIARSVEDLMLMMQVIAGEQFHRLGLDQHLDLQDINIYHQTEASFSLSALPVDSCIKEAIVKSAKYLGKCGCNLNEDKFPELEDSVDISVSLFYTMKDIPDILHDPANPKCTKSLIIEMLKVPFGGCHRSFQSLCFTAVQKTQLFIPESSRPKLKQKADELSKKLISKLGTNGVFLYPAFNSVAFHHNQISFRSSGVMYTMIFNILGFCSTVVPVGMYEGLPVAIQVVAAPNQDRLCLAVAKQLEKGFGGWTLPQ